MICDKCGHELQDGQVYCPNCGGEIQLVANYNPTEEEIMGFDKKLVSPDISAFTEDVAENPPEKKSFFNVIKGKRILAAIIAGIILFVLLIVYIVLSNNYDYQLDKAKEALNEGDMRAAVEYGRNAVNLNAKEVDAKWLLFEAYGKLSQFENAYDVLADILSLTSNDAKVYDRGMALFIDRQDYQKAADLLETTSDVNIRDKYYMYIASAPEADLGGGMYKSEPEVKLSAPGKVTIFYSIDQENPASGATYSEAVKIPAGNHILRAICVNQFGVESKEIEIEYDVTPGLPDMPEFLPSEVNVEADTQITIKAPANSRIYYTWDGSEPTINSTEYTEPITAPEGNNILSAIAVDKYGQISSIAKKNYIVAESEKDPYSYE